MLEIHQLTYGALNPTLAYAMSVLGSFLGLLCAGKVRRGGSKGWLIAAAIAIGGTGIWLMHFIAMLGFSIAGSTIRYDIPLTVLSAAVAVIVVGAGLFIVSSGEMRWVVVPLGGMVTGLGVAGMHYLGMAALHTDAKIHYDSGIVTTSVVIAVVAATVALWFTLEVDGRASTMGAALIMGIAVCGMHYTGMAAMTAQRSPDATEPNGADPLTLLLPLGMIASLTITVLIIGIATTEDDGGEVDHAAHRSGERQSADSHHDNL